MTSMTFEHARPIRLSLALCLLPTASLAQNNDWPAAIVAVGKAEQRYIAHVEQRTGGPHLSLLGRWDIQVDVERHKCAILGRMLGRLEEIKLLEELDYPPLDSSVSAYDQAKFAASLGNWVWQAEWAMAANEAERINTWNLDCTGHFDIPVTAQISHSAPEAQFEVDASGTGLRVYGNIDAGFHARFMEQLALHPGIVDVELGSGGGSVSDALKTGREIRARGMRTFLFGNCFSACPLVYIGGVERPVYTDLAVRHDFGFHRLALASGEALPDDHAFYDLIAAYVTQMGGDAETFVGWMLQAAPDEMFKPELHTTCEAGLTTWVERHCTASDSN